MSDTVPQLAKSSRSRPWGSAMAAALLAAAIAVVYSRGVDSPLFFDDRPSVEDNQSIRHLWPLFGTVEEPGPLRPARDLPTAGRPLVNLSFAVNYFFGGNEPRGYHLVNIVLHTLNAWLLGAIIYRTLRLPHFADRFDQAARPLAISVAALWALHPLVTETVIYVTQRTELVVTLFYFATLLGSLNYWQSRRPAWCTGAILACWAGMASKEVMASAPIVVLLFDRAFVGGTLRAAWAKSRPLYVGLFSSWIALLLLNAGGPRSSSAGFHLDIAPTAWWFTQCKVLLMYLKLVVWPWPLAIFYEPPLITSFADAWPFVVPVAALVAVTLLALWRNTAAGWIGVFAFAVLSPTLLVPIATEIAAERRMYMPLAAIIALTIVGLYVALVKLVSMRSAMAAVLSAAMVLAAVGGVVSHRRLAIYDDELAVWQDVTKHQPDNSTAYSNVGTLLMDRDRLDEAMAHFERAIALRPDDYASHHNLGAILTRLGRSDEATAHFKKSVAARPSYTMGHSKLGFTEMKAGRPEKAQHHFEVALRWDPKDADANRGLASALLALGNPGEAETYAQTAVKHAPNDAEAQNVLGAALAQLGLFPQAIEHLETAVRLDPNLPQARGNLMAAYASVGRRDEAIATAQQALSLAQEQGDTGLARKISSFLASYNAAPSAGSATPNE